MFTARVQYALVLLKELKSRPMEPVTLQEVCEKHGLKNDFLLQVARKLRITGYVNSVKGPGGGYVLARDLSGVTFSEVYWDMQPDNLLKLAVTGEEAQAWLSELYREFMNHISEFKAL